MHAAVRAATLTQTMVWRRHAEALLGALKSRAGSQWVAPIVAVLLAIPAIGSRRVFDDHVLELAARGDGAVIPRASGVDLFSFASGDAALNHELMSRGVLLPWWSDPALEIRFFRPLSSLSHRLDFALWPRHTELMYVHGALWLALLVWLVARLYARFEARPAVAILATGLYAVNDAHGTVVAWLSNRNALLSAAGAVACVLAQPSERGAGPRSAWARIVSPLCLAFALACGELGVSAWAFLIAQAVALDRRRVASRARALVPHLLVTLTWAAIHAASGAGTRASDVYLHPLHDPAGFASELPKRAALLLGAALGPVPAELSFLGAAAAVPVAISVAAVVLAALLALQRRALQEDATARFWWVALALAAPPVAASFPSDRLLLLVDVAAMAIVSRALVTLWEERAARVSARTAFGALLFVTHAVVAPLVAPWRARQMQELAQANARAFACLERIPDLEDKVVVVLGAPTDFFVSYLQAERAARGAARPERVYWFTNPAAPLEVQALGERRLALTRQGGFFTTPPERLYRQSSAPLALGERVSLPELSVQVTGVTASGQPERFELSFDEAITAGRYVFLAWRGTAYAPVSPEALAALRVAPAQTLPELLSSAHAHPEPI